MAKVIFHFRDFVAGTKNGGFRYAYDKIIENLLVLCEKVLIRVKTLILPYTHCK
jgi:hypothetical protein